MNFGRQIIVQIGPEGGEGREFRDIRISGRVDKSPTRGPNEAVLELYNVSPDSIALAQTPQARVRIMAGYDTPRLIFEGNIIREGAIVTKEGVDRILSIEAIDGGALRTAHISETFSQELSMEQAFQALAERMGLKPGFVFQAPDLRLPRGTAMVGPVRDVLDEVSSSVGAEWSIQDGALQVLRPQDHTDEEAVVISAQNGNLIGSPSPGSDGLEVKALLDGRIRPGRRFIVESDQFDGEFRAVEVQHIFDSGWDSSFFTTVIGKEV